MAVIAVGSRPETPDVTKFFELLAVDRRFEGMAMRGGGQGGREGFVYQEFISPLGVGWRRGEGSGGGRERPRLLKCDQYGFILTNSDTQPHEEEPAKGRRLFVGYEKVACPSANKQSDGRSDEVEREVSLSLTNQHGNLVTLLSKRKTIKPGSKENAREHLMKCINNRYLTIDHFDGGSPTTPAPTPQTPTLLDFNARSRVRPTSCSSFAHETH